jgi:hypothetical protein
MEGMMTIENLEQLKAALDKLTPDQLKQPVRWSGEERSGKIETMWVLTEDHVNPSGDGLEPVSMYEDEPEAIEAETRTPAGTVLLLVD